MNLFRVISLCVLPTFLVALTIEEKAGSAPSAPALASSEVSSINEELRMLKAKLRNKYAAAAKVPLSAEGAKEALQEINLLKDEIAQLEMRWKEVIGSTTTQEDYALWDQDETTLSQIIMEFGACDFLYVIPPEIFNMKLNLHSGVPIPRESWSELIDIILSQNGVGVKELNPYVKQLYLLKQDLIAVSAIVNDRKALGLIPSHARIIYIFSSEPESARNVAYFFERFRDPRKTYIHQIGSKVVIVAAKDEIEKLISLHDAVWEKQSEKVSKVIPLSKISPPEMEKILKAYFSDGNERNRIGPPLRSGEDLSILSLTQENAIVLVGMQESVKRGEKIIKETEGQVSDPSEMTVYWYNCKHSDPIDLCDVLDKVYQSLIGAKITEGMKTNETTAQEDTSSDISLKVTPPPIYGPPAAPLVVQPPLALATTVTSQVQKSTTLNFIPYPKNGSIMMVVKKDLLDKIKDLLRKLDIPKKMVQMEVLLFEKKIHSKNNFGLNILKLGSAAKNSHDTGLSFETNPGPLKGLLHFFLSRTKSNGGFPPYDLAYNFLMSQEDIRINASPSVTTVNQTPAQVSIVEEISINNGAAPINTNAGIVFENSYTRAQYGVTIVMTPTIHEADPFDRDEHRFITLETNVTFDSIHTDINDRPKVNRRHLENLVRVLDGETVILGGLRRKMAEDKMEKIPFLGEIPGIAKLFGSSQLSDESTEMIIFITPKIVFDSKSELIRLRTEELKRRPGDLPEFLVRALESQENQKRKLLQNSLKLFFGNNNDFFLQS